VYADHDGDTIYGDYTVDEETSTVTPLASYLSGVGQVDEATGAVYYDHADHLGSVCVVTTCGVGAGDCVPGEAGTVVERIVHTAFGEPVTRLGIAPTPTRYLYAGAWGYESDLGAAHAGGAPGDDALPYTHVGHRWYDPASGRFLQRDPIGIMGGPHVYAYVGHGPQTEVDPHGMMPIGGGCPWCGRWNCGGHHNHKTSRSTASAFKSPNTIQEEVYEKGSRTGKSDDWMHFVVCCRMVRETPGGLVIALPGGFVKELFDQAGAILGNRPGDVADSWHDMVSNFKGWLQGWVGLAYPCDCETAADAAAL